MWGNHTGWISLTDRSFTGRHLPPAPAGRPLPTEAQVLELFRRPSLQQALTRNAADPAAAFTRFTYGPERRRRRGPLIG